MDSVHGNGSSKNTSVKAESLLSKGSSQPVILSGNFENEEQSRTNSDSTFEGVTPHGTDISMSPHSAASSSLESDSTVADDFQSSPIGFPNSSNKDPQSSLEAMENAKLHRRDVNDVSVATLLSMEKICGSPGPISQVSDITRSLHFPTLSPTQSPPVQIMERSESYDPNRISSSVFISGSSTPMDWSVNSNDSLFSIPIGNSLAREQFAAAESLHLREFMNTEESQKWKVLHKSGELCRSNELQSPGLVKFPNQDTVLGKTSAVAKEKKDKPKMLDLKKNRVLLTDQLNYKANQERYKNKTAIRHSDEKGTNNQSSELSLTRKPSKKSCCLCSSNCSWGCCPRKPCTWGCCLCFSNCYWVCCSRKPCWSCSPSCCCKCPSWSACPFKCNSPNCCSWKNSLSCCCKWPSRSACSFKCNSPDCSCWKNTLRCCCKWPRCSACSFKCNSPDCSSWKNIKNLFCCSSCKGLKDWRRRKWCSCPCCCSCCSSCSYSCC